MSKGKGQSRGAGGEPLALYLKDLSSLQTLTREEEIELAQRVQKGDKEALRKLVEGNLRFVVSVAAKYSDSRIPLIDLINEGNIGLIKAAEKFNPDKGVKFITYAVWWIVAAIKHALAKQTGVIGLPLKHPNTVYKINRKEEELSKQLGRNPTRDEVAKALGLTKQDIELNLKAARTPLFLDATISDDPSVSYLNTIKADFDIDRDLLAKNLRNEIEDLIEVLGEREQTIIKMRFGLDDREPMTLREIGQKMGLSKERIRQIEDRALGQLHKAAKDRELEAFLS
jgi:RNA polymerase primary sigma factor